MSDFPYIGRLLLFHSYRVYPPRYFCISIIIAQNPAVSTAKLLKSYKIEFILPTYYQKWTTTCHHSGSIIRFSGNLCINILQWIIAWNSLVMQPNNTFVNQQVPLILPPIRFRIKAVYSKILVQTENHHWCLKIIFVIIIYPALL